MVKQGQAIATTTEPDNLGQYLFRLVTVLLRSFSESQIPQVYLCYQ